MPDLTFLSSWTQEVDVDEMQDLAFLSSWTQGDDPVREHGCRQFWPSRTNKGREDENYLVISVALLSFRSTPINVSTTQKYIS